MKSEENMTYDLSSELWFPSYMLGIPNVHIIGTSVDQDRYLIIDVKSNEVGTQCHQCGKET